MNDSKILRLVLRKWRLEDHEGGTNMTLICTSNNAKASGYLLLD